MLHVTVKYLAAGVYCKEGMVFRDELVRIQYSGDMQLGILLIRTQWHLVWGWAAASQGHGGRST